MLVELHKMEYFKYSTSCSILQHKVYLAHDKGKINADSVITTNSAITTTPIVFHVHNIIVCLKCSLVLCKW